MNTPSFKSIEKYLPFIFNNIEYNLSILDKDLNVLWSNKAFVDRLGMNSEDILGKKCYTLWHKRTIPCENCPCVKALETGNIETAERVSDEGRYYILTGIPIKEDGEIKGVFEIGREITERKIVDEKFKEVIKLEGVYEIIDNLAHHFNNIFNGIYGFAQLLKTHMKCEESLNFIEKLIESVERGSKFIKTLLALKIDPSVRKVFDLNFLLISMKEIFQNIAGEKINIEFYLYKENPLIKGDPLQIREILIELIQNAKNAIPEDGFISISTEKTKINSQEKVVLTISDTGHGMDEDTLQRCFEPLFTQDPRKFGLGLSIVKNIVQKHNGTIEIKSSPNVGTTVKIYFPSATLQQEQDI